LIILGSIRYITAFSFPRWETIRKRLLESAPRQWSIRFLGCQRHKLWRIRPRRTSYLSEATIGKLYVYDGTTFDLITSIDFGDNVDNLRYDAAEKRLYLGYGDEKTGAIGMVDAATNKRLDDEFKLGAHPESFQLSASGPNIYVNLPDLKQIAVINRSTHSIVRWPLTFESNFPMALDEADTGSSSPPECLLDWLCLTRVRDTWSRPFRLSKTPITTSSACEFRRL